MYFEQAVLCETESGRAITERRYEDGRVEWWGVMNLSFNDGARQGSAQFPFQITASCRTTAFENYANAMALAEPKAKAEIHAKIAAEDAKARSKVVLARALPPNGVRQ